MAKLFTHHDPYNIHKILGGFIILHTFYRCYLILFFGTAFPENESVWRQSIGVLAHISLSCSSLLIPIPKKRNFNSPMIWPEFRLHSILFATRHMLSTLITLHNLWPEDIYLEAISKYSLLFTNIQLAKYITKEYGDHEKRTTNAMPYPKDVTEEQKKAIKKEYANSQFAATAGAVISEPTLSWISVIPIQIAPLLMTLVRKGIVSSYTYHQVYAFSLWSNVLLAFFMILHNTLDEMKTMQLLLGSGCQMCLRNIRYKYNISQEYIWATHVFIMYVLYPKLFEEGYISLLSPYFINYIGPILFCYTLINDFSIYITLSV